MPLLPLLSPTRCAAERQGLARAVAGLSPVARSALAEALRRGPVRRRTWRGCPLARAGEVVGLDVAHRDDAVLVLQLEPPAVRRFVRAWDSLTGSDRRCRRLLEEVLRDAGVKEQPTAPERGAAQPAAVAVQGSSSSAA